MNRPVQLNLPNFINPLFDIDQLDSPYRKIAIDWAQQGYCIIDFPDNTFSELSLQIIEELKDYFDFQKIQQNADTNRRKQDAIDLDGVRKIATNQVIIEILSKVYGKKAFPFQTLNFPVGSQQASHSDHVHFDSVPNQFMAGVWVALEDTDENNGSLFYYPGSHLWPRLDNTLLGSHSTEELANSYDLFPQAWDAIATKKGVIKTQFHAKKGQCLLWASNLVHGGSPQKDPYRTRWSQVTHYFFEDCLYYTPLHSKEFFNKTAWRDIMDISSGATYPSRKI
jgi:hypothetical protein